MPEWALQVIWFLSFAASSSWWGLLACSLLEAVRLAVQGIPLDRYGSGVAPRLPSEQLSYASQWDLRTQGVWKSGGERFIYEL